MTAPRMGRRESGLTEGGASKPDVVARGAVGLVRGKTTGQHVRAQMQEVCG